MKRNRHFKPQVFSTEKELQYEVQCAINNIEETDKISYKRCELITEILTKLSFYLPDIYDVFFDYESILMIKSHAAPGFSFELFVPVTKVNEYDDAGYASLTIYHAEFDQWEDRCHHRVIYLNLLNIERRNEPLSLDTAISYIKAIVRNPKVAFYHYWNHVDDRLRCKELLSEESFTEENVKKAIEGYKYYFKSKQKSSAIINEYKTEFKKLIDEACKKYSDKIYKLGWGICCDNYKLKTDDITIAIRTRAKIYYGDNKLYDKFANEFAMEFANFSKQYIERYRDEVLESLNHHVDISSWFGFKEISPISIFVDGDWFNNNQCVFLRNDLCWYLLSDKLSCPHWFNKIIYVKRKGE